jgi:predicted DNA-binding transcriptional regulator AlpA
MSDHLAVVLTEAQLDALAERVAAKLNGHGSGQAPTPLPDHLLTAKEVAPRLGCSARYVYAHAAEYPFTVRLGPQAVRFSAVGLERWLAKR